MKAAIKEIGVWLVLGTVALFGMVVISDAAQFYDLVHTNQKSNQPTVCCSWYEPNWITSPYTNFRLSLETGTYHWTKNGVGESWYVRDVQVGNTVFWTIIDRCGGPKPVKQCVVEQP